MPVGFRSHENRFANGAVYKVQVPIPMRDWAAFIHTLIMSGVPVVRKGGAVWRDMILTIMEEITRDESRQRFRTDRQAVQFLLKAGFSVYPSILDQVGIDRETHESLWLDDEPDYDFKTFLKEELESRKKRKATDYQDRYRRQRLAQDELERQRLEELQGLSTQPEGSVRPMAVEGLDKVLG